jgi:hypothetical protein
MNIYAYFLDNQRQPIHKSVHYFMVYERHFRRYVGLPVTMLEIGTGGGGSSQMWKRYFGPLARIITVDVRPECREFEDDQVKVRIGNQSDPAFLESIVTEFGSPDIVLDDGSHQMADVIATFGFLYSKVTRNGTYMVEDMHTAYWKDWGGGFRREGTFIEMCKNLIDELNADHTQGALDPTSFTRGTTSMHFYDSIVVFERGGYLTKRSVVSGDPNLPFG